MPRLAAEIALFALISLPALMLVTLGSLGFVADALGPSGTHELNRIVFELPREFLSAQTYDSYERLASAVLADGRADVISIGALLSVWLMAAAGLRAHLAVTLGGDAVFSQLGVPIAVVLWLYVSSIAMLLGAELNAEIEQMWPTTGHTPTVGTSMRGPAHAENDGRRQRRSPYWRCATSTWGATSDLENRDRLTAKLEGSVRDGTIGRVD